MTSFGTVVGKQMNTCNMLCYPQQYKTRTSMWSRFEKQREDWSHLLRQLFASRYRLSENPHMQFLHHNRCSLFLGSQNATESGYWVSISKKCSEVGSTCVDGYGHTPCVETGVSKIRI
ncbi:uncharacterized protein [Primulina eburnea]|uniref:uncharacterized protein n=1 Tax=Primulina eburnea TaxID=1245227 RepID=UPI003C6C104E